MHPFIGLVGGMNMKIKSLVAKVLEQKNYSTQVQQFASDFIGVLDKYENDATSKALYDFLFDVVLENDKLFDKYVKDMDYTHIDEIDFWEMAKP